MEIKTTCEIEEMCNNDIVCKDCEYENIKWIVVNDLIKKLRKKGITKYHILGELLNTTFQKKTNEADKSE